MQLFSADSTIFFKKKIKMPSKVTNIRLGWAVFSTDNLHKTSPNLKLCFIKTAHGVTNV